MRIKYDTQVGSLDRNVPANNVSGMIVTDGHGGFCYLPSDAPTSRYQGAFFIWQNRLLKIIEALEVQEQGNVVEMKYDGQTIERVWQSGIRDSFAWVGAGELLWSASQRTELKMVFDVRAPYEMPTWGRQYGVDVILNRAIIKYDDVKVLLEGDGSFEAINQWFERDYPRDRERQSEPSRMWVWHGLNFTGTRMLIQVAGGSESRPHHELLMSNQASISASQGITEQRVAAWLAKRSLESLIVHDERGNAKGIYAGLPWFFQFWARDEALSLYLAGKTLNLADTQQILMLRQNDLTQGLLPARLELSGEKSSALSGDGSLLSWYLINGGNTSAWLERLGYQVEQGSWMDSLSERRGELVEIEAMIAGLLEGDARARRVRRIREQFWNGVFLTDRARDTTVRPNVFLAYLFCQDILTNQEWQQCFDHLLGRLWLDWGGFATIDKFDARFVPKHSGENPASYHNGDSWFFLNNIAAAAMARVDASKYAAQIRKILNASTEDILWRGAAGHASELSSACEFYPAGSLMQAWSAASYIALNNQKFKHRWHTV